MQLTKIYKKNCIGRVPSSIADLEECALCENEEICASLWGGPQVVRHSTSDSSAHRESEETTIGKS